MTTANKITLFRVILIPVFLILLYTGAKWAALAVYIVACISDTVDGYIARHYNQVTDFGKFMDPLADKLLVITAMICLIDTGEIPSWVVMVIIAREFIISGFRLVAADNGIVIAASKWGKLKTITQMTMIIVVLLNVPVFRILEQVLIYLALILTVVSLMDYIMKNKQVLGSTK